MKKIENEIRDLLYGFIKDKYPDIETVEIIFSIPPKRDYGDLSTPLPFAIAKKTGEKPFEIGRELAKYLNEKGGSFSKIDIQGGGFLNFTLDRDEFFNYLIENMGEPAEKKSEKIVVEHTSINPNKSAHIGHLRNACIGDTLVRGLRFLGYGVEVQNYLDDTGIQVADVVWGLTKYEEYNLDEIKNIPDITLYLWEKYPEYSSKLKESDNFNSERDLVHKQIEEKGEPFYSVGEYISESVVKDHIRVMDSIDIHYDVLIRERDIIELDFFRETSAILSDSGIMYDSNDPEKENCKVIKYNKENIEKIVVRSNGTITYIGKDIAYALWKVGLTSKNFFFEKFFTYKNGKEIFISSFIKNSNKISFGHGDRIFTVIDVRQSYLQNIISTEVIGRISKNRKEDAYVHFSYEMVALTPECVRDLGFDLSEEESKKSHIEVSGRKGIAVSANDLIDKLTQRSKEEIKKRDPGSDEKMLNSISKKIAVGALRYFMLKFNSNTVISFDFNDALSFEGDTGPYLQYSLVRINSILKKVEKDIFDKTGKDLLLSLLGKEERELVFEILLKLSTIEINVEMAIEKRELSFISSHTYSICQLFNQYYHKYPVISEKNPDVRTVRLQLLILIKTGLEILFEILGIPVPEKM